MTKTPLVPVLAADGALIGHIPNRASKNPVIGVIRCDCGEPATVHNPKGRRSGHYYTMCSDCGTDQRSGEKRQQFIRSVMVPTVEELPALTLDAPEKSEKLTITEPLPDIASKPEAEPAKPEIKPQQAVTEKPLKAATDTAYTVNDPLPENEPEDEPEIKPIGLFAIAGAVLGGLLAFAA